MNSNNIKDIIARYILDSRGNPTVEVDVILNSGIMGRASVPSGASTGIYEALELRDLGRDYMGKGVKNAINNIHNKIKPLLINHDIQDIKKIDRLMIEADGTPNKSVLGANSILGVSLACVKAASKEKNLPLYKHINELYGHKLKMPIPMMNILNGGSHADNLLDIQEFMIYPDGFSTFEDSLRAGTEIFHTLKKILKKRNHNTNIGDEGGFAPSLSKNQEALDLIMEAIEKAGYKPKKEINLALDVAASEIYNKKTKLYSLKAENKEYSSDDMIDYYSYLSKEYPIVSIEDGLDENDWDGWTKLTATLGKFYSNSRR